MSSKTRQQLEAWIKTIVLDADSKVLDVGGAQKPAKSRITRGELFDFTVLDLENPHEDSPKPDIECDLNEVDYIHTAHNEYPDCWEEPKYRTKIVGFYKGTFDYALCFEVAEYWWNPFQALKNINFFLKEGGKLYLSIPFVYPVHNPKHNDYLRYTDMGISMLLEKAGFRIDKISSRKAGQYNVLDTFYSAEGMKKCRSYASHDSMGWLIEATKI